MVKRMLIDATHPEETRVVVLNGNRLEEFDFESASKKQLKGNIYLAKVTRVEPSLQAAFVEYGGNRHGFLAFSEIHPDYYQIPLADRMALLQDEEEEHARENEREDEEGERNATGQRGPRRSNRDAPRRSRNSGSTDEPSLELETNGSEENGENGREDSDNVEASGEDADDRSDSSASDDMP